MLRSEHLRFHIDGGLVWPSRLGERWVRTAEEAARVFRRHVGRRRGELEEALRDLEGERDFVVVRGLSKLIEEGCEFEVRCPLSGPETRRRVFDAAARMGPILAEPDLLGGTTRRDLLRKVADRWGVSPRDVEDSLYGDLEENRILTRVPAMDPARLVDRYNLGQAQGLLYTARWARFTVLEKFKKFFTHAGLARLMHRIEPRPNGGYTVHLDGPASIVRRTRRYGVRLARVLPAACLAGRWAMEAALLVYGEEKRLRLDERWGLKTHYRDAPPHDSKLEEKFEERFRKKKGNPWIIEREGAVIDLGGEVMIPDFTFRHPDGRKAFLEIVGFWTPEYLRRKREIVRRAKVENLIWAVAAELNCSREDFPEALIFYKQALKAPEVLERLEKIGRA